jgi:hypothetical protein
MGVRNDLICSMILVRFQGQATFRKRSLSLIFRPQSDLLPGERNI